MPVWMMSELISLGSLSRLYRGMQHSDKRIVASQLNIHHKRLQDWLHVLTYVRNVCAHRSRLWNRELAIKPMAMAESEWNHPFLLNRDRVFCVLLMLRYLLRQTEKGTEWLDHCNQALTPIAATYSTTLRQFFATYSFKVKNEPHQQCKKCKSSPQYVMKHIFKKYN
jgi:abortive infection bacteriophage resistance protein